jgi:hypothetical protein
MLTKETNVPYFQRGAPKNGICFDDSFLPKSFTDNSPPQTSSGSQTVGLTSFFFFFHGLPPWQMSHHTESPFPVPPPSPNAVWLRYSSQIELFLLLRNLPGSTIDPPPSFLLASPPPPFHGNICPYFFAQLAFNTFLRTFLPPPAPLRTCLVQYV